MSDALASIPFRAFLNGIKILRLLDRNEVEGAGIVMGEAQWAIFNECPVRFFIKANDLQQAALWTLIQQWQPEELRATEREPA